MICYMKKIDFSWNLMANYQPQAITCVSHFLISTGHKMKTERSPQVFTGQVKFARSTCTRAAECKEWRSGSITFEQRENDWKLDIHLDAFAEYPALMPALTMIVSII